MCGSVPLYKLVEGTSGKRLSPLPELHRLRHAYSTDFGTRVRTDERTDERTDDLYYFEVMFSLPIASMRIWKSADKR